MAQYFYDGQVRRYILQVVRLLSNFVVKKGDGTLDRVPVMYGDMDRQVASIINQNSENTLAYAPRIAVYINDLALDRSRLADSTYVGKLHIRERDFDQTAGTYGHTQGANYTVERLMPTPFTLSFNVDIWTTSTEQKLQVLEQILMLFNPSLEIQTNDNYIDWTSLSVVDLLDINFSSRTVPVGTQDQIDIATLKLQTPIYLSPPAKVKKLGVVTNIITSLFGNITEPDKGYIDGLGVDQYSGSVGMSDLLYQSSTTVGDYNILVTGKEVKIQTLADSPVNTWAGYFDQIPGQYIAGAAKIYLRQPDMTEVAGYAAINPLNDTILSISDWDIDTYPLNTTIEGPGRHENSWGSFDAVVDPTTTKPTNLVVGTRYLIIDNIGGGHRETFVLNSSIMLIPTGTEFNEVNDFKLFVNGVEQPASGVDKEGMFVIHSSAMIPSGSTISYELYLNDDGPDAWKNANGDDFIADANDIIEWDGTQWHIIFSAKDNTDSIIYQTNIFTLTQYKWNGVSWVKSFEGEYKKGEWRIEL